jgi:NADPH2:quinone reductase
MKAVLCTAFGGPDTLEIADLPAPRPKEGEVVVRVGAAALNFFDTLIIAGKYQTRPPLPFSPGGELSGTVIETGEGVSEFAVGERVMGHIGWGGARELAVVPASRLAKVPDGLSDEVAAGLIIAYGTTLHAFRDRANLQPGETVAVLGASGGVGLAAIEIAKAMGARVIACASSQEKLEFCRDHGADETLDYSKEDLKAGLKARTGGAGVDVVYDPVGGELAEAALRATGWNGRFLVIGFASGEIPRIPINLCLLKGNAIVGVNWGEFAVRDPEASRLNNGRIMEWVRDGRLKPHVHRAYPLEKTAEALGVIARREVKGKIVIVP